MGQLQPLCLPHVRRVARSLGFAALGAHTKMAKPEMTSRQALLKKLQTLDTLDEAHLPVVTIDDYFEQNDQEESIAPNNWEFGRPPIKTIYKVLKDIEARPDVAGVYVGLHEDWVSALEHDDEWPAAENVHIYTSAPLETVEKWVQDLFTDGVGEGWPYGQHAGAPALPSGYTVFTLYWD